MNENEFRIGAVLRQATATAWTGLGRWIALSALIQTPIFFYMLSGLNQHVPENAFAATAKATVHIGFLVLAEAAVTAAMLAHLRGQRVSLGELVGMTLRPAPLLLFAAAYGVVSSLVVLVPYSFEFRFSYWSYYWMEPVYDALLYPFVVVAVPVLVNERTGALGALKRNVSLTEQSRGRLLGIYVLIAFIGSFAMLLGSLGIVTSEHGVEGLMVLTMARKVIGPVIWGAVNASIYRSLRLLREGVDITSTPSVPDARIHTPG